MSAFRRNSVIPSSIRRIRPAESYPLLDLKDIAASLQEISRFPIDEELLARPTQQYVTILYGDIIDCFVGISDQHIRTALDAAVTKVDNAESNTQEDSRMLLALHRHICRFMKDCGVDDFSIMDTAKPEPGRLRRNLSAIIAFAHFREDRMRDFQDLTDKCNDQSVQLRRLEEEHEELMTRITELEQHMQESADKAKETQVHNEEVESELRKLKKVQEQLTIEHGDYKQQKQKMVGKLQDHSFLIVEARKENDRMRAYVVDSPEMLHKINADLSGSVQINKIAIDTMEKRIRALQVSMESFKQINLNVQACIKVIRECEEGIQREKEAMAKLGRYQEIYEQRRRDVEDLDIKITQLKRQIANSDERLDRAQKQAEIKRGSAEKKMAELRDTHGTIVTERSLLNKEMQQKRGYIVETERKIQALRDDLDGEVRAISAEAERLYGHINLYLNSMEKRMLM
jgi:kinetochore protein Nuf2